jgi:hypothetical protein
MTPDLAATQDPSADLSLKKQQVFRRYANGEITWLQVADGIDSIKPPRNLSTRQKIALFVSTILLSILTPPWAKR